VSFVLSSSVISNNISLKATKCYISLDGWDEDSTLYSVIKHGMPSYKSRKDSLVDFVILIMPSLCDQPLNDILLNFFSWNGFSSVNFFGTSNLATKFIFLQNITKHPQRQPGLRVCAGLLELCDMENACRRKSGILQQLAMEGCCKEDSAHSRVR
jgi:hypothetical protein